MCNMRFYYHYRPTEMGSAADSRRPCMETARSKLLHPPPCTHTRTTSQTEQKGLLAIRQQVVISRVPLASCHWTWSSEHAALSPPNPPWRQDTVAACQTIMPLASPVHTATPPATAADRTHRRAIRCAREAARCRR